MNHLSLICPSQSGQLCNFCCSAWRARRLLGKLLLPLAGFVLLIPGFPQQILPVSLSSVPRLVAKLPALEWLPFHKDLLHLAASALQMLWVVWQLGENAEVLWWDPGDGGILVVLGSSWWWDPHPPGILVVVGSWSC